MAITAILDLQLKPEAIAGAREELHRILSDTRKFDGCLGVDVLFDVNDPAHVILIESWESEEHDAAYRAWRAGPGTSNLGSMLAGPPISTNFRLAEGV